MEITKEAIWIGRLLKELCQPKIYLFSLHCENQNLIALSKNSENHKRTKHINVWYYYIQEKKKDGTIAINYLLIEKMIVDRLTKALTSAKIKSFLLSS